MHAKFLESVVYKYALVIDKKSVVIYGQRKPKTGCASADASFGALANGTKDITKSSSLAWDIFDIGLSTEGGAKARTVQYEKFKFMQVILHKRQVFSVVLVILRCFPYTWVLFYSDQHVTVK